MRVLLMSFVRRAAEWNTCYHYLFAELLSRKHEAHISYLLKPRLSGFIAIYPNGVCHFGSSKLLLRDSTDCWCRSGLCARLGEKRV
jgi:hypothetical protein